MVRAPCCDKKTVKKGQWTEEEDRILTSHIHKYGHANWRALPKQAGLQRCGKSCRLRWVNYLRPDVKRGNFSMEEEDLIVCLHQKLGNRWSAIAEQLPGRTDNEIKNVWNTRLKKRLGSNTSSQESDLGNHGTNIQQHSNEASTSSSCSRSSSSCSTSEAREPMERLTDYSWEELSLIDDSGILPNQILMENFDWDHNQPQGDHHLMVESNLVSCQRSIHIDDSSSLGNASSEGCDSNIGLPEPYSWELLHESENISSGSIEPSLANYDWKQECLSSISWEEEDWDAEFWKTMLVTQSDQL